MAIRIPKDESETVEFKPSLSDPERIVEILASMANLKGGIIYVGVRRERNRLLKIFDFDLGRRSIESLINKITDNTEPVIYPRVKVETVSRKKILIIQVDEGSTKPYTAFGRPFKRVGKVTKRMDRDEFECLLRETKHIYYGTLPCKEAKIGDLDTRKITEYLTLCKRSRGIPVDLNLPIKENLQKLKAIDHSTDNPTRAAILLFGRNPQEFLPHAQIRCARFKGKSKGDFIDMQDFSDTLPEMIENTLQFISRNTRVAAKVIGSQRAEVTEYPMLAIREAIVNAICHRDYTIEGDDIRVAIFDDRIEVQSPGGLPGHLTLENIEKEHYLRNPLIAQLLFNIKYVERWNTGIRKMKEWMKEHRLEEPIFEDAKTSFRAIFKGPEDLILDLLPSGQEGKVTDLSHLNGHQLQALKDLYNEGKNISRKEYAKKFGVSIRTAQRDLRQLCEENLIKEIGKGRSVRYH